MNGESMERLMEIILQMQINLAHVTHTLQEQTYEIRQQLEIIFQEQKKDLNGCLRRIDEKLNECSVCVEDYRRGYSTLETMRHKLVQLGAEPASMPAPLPADGIDGIVQWRLNELRSQGRIS